MKDTLERICNKIVESEAGRMGDAAIIQEWKNREFAWLYGLSAPALEALAEKHGVLGPGEFLEIIDE